MRACRAPYLNLLGFTFVQRRLFSLFASAFFITLSGRSALALAPSTTTLTLTSSGVAVTSIVSRDVVTLTATTKVSGAAITLGTINFCNTAQLSCTGAALVGTAQLTSTGIATFSFRPGIGTHTYRALFLGNTADARSSSSTVTLDVTTPAAATLSTITMLSVDSSGESPAFTASVTGIGKTSPTGTIDLVDTTHGNSVLASPALVTQPTGESFPPVPKSTDFNNAIPLISGDFNGDGYPDLITQLVDGSVVSQLGDGNNGFKTVAALPSHGPAAVGDFNSDGKLDLALCSGGAVNIFLGDGTGHFAAAPIGTPITVSAIELAVADINNDGILDLITQDPSTTSVFLGVGDGTFTAGSSTTIIDAGGFESLYSMVQGDFNADGNADIAVAWSIFPGADTTQFPVTFLFGDGTGNFTTSMVVPNLDPADGTFPPTSLVGALPESMILLAADVNGDGKEDVIASFGFVACCPGTQNIGAVNLLNNGDSTITVSGLSGGPGYQGGPVAAANVDFTGDGSTATAFEFGEGSGNPILGVPPFAPFIAFLGSPYTLGLPDMFSGGFVAADFNGDGISEIALGGPAGTTIVGFQTTSVATMSGIGRLSTPSGTHLIKATYNGDATHLSSVSNTVSLNTGIATPTITLAAPASVPYGNPVTITATLVSAGATPTGIITFLNGGAAIGTATLNNGIGALTFKNLSIGTYTITVTYPGDSNNTAASSSPVIVTVGKQAPTLSLTTPTGTIAYGGALTLTAKLTNLRATPASGKIAFQFLEMTIDSQPLNSNGEATLTLAMSALPVGSDSITASYAGDTDYAAATSAPLIITVNKAAPSLTLTSSASLLNVGSTDILTLTLGPSSAKATGSVSFQAGSIVLGSSPLNKASASFTTTLLPAGIDSVTATYSGDDSFTSGTSDPITIKVSPTLTLTSSAATIYAGVPDTISAVLGNGQGTSIPTGTVTLISGTYNSGSVSLSAGMAAITIPANVLAIGSDTLTATYSGDSTYPPSSATILLAVSSAPPPGFNITASSVTLTPGATTGNSAQVTLAPITGFTGKVALSAQVTSSPTGATDPPTVSFGTNNSVDLNGSSNATATLNISTTAPITAKVRARTRSASSSSSHGLVAAGGAALASLLLLGIPACKYRKAGHLSSMSTLVLVFTLTLLITILAACGGKSGPPKVIDPGTTPGSYTITVTGVSGSVTSTGTVTLTVQ